MGAGNPVTIWIADLSTAAFRRTDDHFLVGMNDLLNCNWVGENLQNQTTGVTSTHRQPYGERSKKTET
jgi:hypothetical protein